MKIFLKIRKGNNGFGYDPIFIPENKRKTFGEMKSSQKYKLDHRYKAFKKIKKFLWANLYLLDRNSTDD